MATFYTCKNDRAFKEVFLKPDNSDLLKALLEFILKIKIDKLEIKKTELLSGNVNIKDKRVDAIVHTGNKKIEIEINSQNKDYLHTRSTAYICNIYQSNASVGDTYNEDTDIIQVNLTWGLGRNNDEMKIYKIMNEKGELYVKNFIIYEINMDYYDKIWYSKNEEEIKKNQYMIMLDLDKKELENMPKDKIVDKYITNVTIVNDDPEFQKYMSEEEDKKKIQNSLLSEAKEEGISQGYTSGINDGIKQTAKNLLSMNMPIEDISKATGLSIEEINLGVMTTLASQAGEFESVVSEVLKAITEAIATEEQMKIYTSGATNIFKYPELSDKERASQLLTTLEEKSQLTELINESDEETGIQVYIGSESPVQSMKDCSVVTATYELQDGFKGTIGIIGPKRMDYEKVVETLRVVKEQLGQTLDDK